MLSHCVESLTKCHVGGVELALPLSVQLLTYQPPFSVCIVRAPVALLTLTLSAPCAVYPCAVCSLCGLPLRCLPLAWSTLALSAPHAVYPRAVCPLCGLPLHCLPLMWSTLALSPSCCHPRVVCPRAAHPCTVCSCAVCPSHCSPSRSHPCAVCPLRCLPSHCLPLALSALTLLTLVLSALMLSAPLLFWHHSQVFLSATCVRYSIFRPCFSALSLAPWTLPFLV